MEVPAEVRVALQAGTPVEVLVQVDAHDLRHRPQEVIGWADEWSVRADRFERTLPARVAHREHFAHLPIAVVEVADLAAAEALAAHSDVVRLDPVVQYELALTQSLHLIHQPEAAALGFQGAGTAVAVLDTGADYTQSDLGNCTAVGSPATCRVVYADDFAPQDGSLDDNGHGTNVSSIVARVAPGADIIALDVFSGATASSTDILAALDWVVDNQAVYDIAAVNMSLGSGAYTAPCVDVFASGIDAVRAAGVGVVVASGNNGYTNKIASPACNAGSFSVGAVYDSNIGGISWSGCTDSTTAADKVTCFSNSANFLDILAPGALIYAGGVTQGGTSQASPHVAGAFAVVRAANPTATVDELEDLLVTTGTAITDPRNGMTFPRLDLLAAVDDCVSSVTPTSVTPAVGGDSGTVTITADAGCAWDTSSNATWLTVSPASGTGSGTVSWTAAANTGVARDAVMSVAGRSVTAAQDGASGPSGGIVINDGAAATTSRTVTLALDAAGAATMCISNTSSCTSWLTYATSRSWSLSSGSGTRTVSVWYRDANSIQSGPFSDDIVLDSVKPTNGTVGAVGSDGQAVLSWTGFADAASGIDHYVVTQKTGTKSPRSSCTDAPVWTGTDETVTLTGLPNGTAHTWRVCAVDVAGNVSTGSTASATPAPEYVAPTGSLTLNGGDAWSSSSRLTASLAATDASGVSKACLSNSTTCTSFFTMVDSKTWSVSGSGLKTVNVWYQDVYGNVGGPFSDTISVDTVKPTNGTVLATGSSQTVTLTFDGFADGLSGLAGYVVTSNVGTSAPTSSCTGTPVWTGTGSPATVTGLVDGTTYTMRLCAVDVAGNLSTGVTATVRPAPEYTAPTGSIVLNGGDAWSNTSRLTATLSATDASGVSRACLSTTSSCTSFFTMVDTKTYSVGGTGTKTVNVWYEDAYGNVGGPFSDDIGIDSVRPTNGTVSATAASQTITLAFDGFADGLSGIASYIATVDDRTPSSYCTGTPAWTGTSSPATLTGLVDGTTYTARLCAVDVAGNVSSGVTVDARPAPEYSAPVGAITLNDGDTWSKRHGDRGDERDRPVRRGGCVPVEHHQLHVVVRVRPDEELDRVGDRAADGVREVPRHLRQRERARERDNQRRYRGARERNGDGGAGGRPGDAVVVGLLGRAVGAASYVVTQATGTATPSSTCTGTPVWTGTATTATLTGLPNGTQHTWRVCAVDVAGMVSTGVTATATPAPEFAAPTGTVSINGGAVWTSSRSVTLDLTATDASGVAKLCTATGTACTSYRTYSDTTTMSLSTGDGTKTANVWFEDVWGNRARCR
ncbi:MAG: S8 family serine peptidase [Myxococcota bacterium]